MYYNRFLLFLLIFATMSDVQSQCSIRKPFQNCTKLFRKFQEALFENKDNVFVLQSVFYPPTQLTPVLVKFLYKLNISTSCQELEVACPFSLSTICNENGSYTFGWTTREIYKIFHPSIINQLRLQLPFWLLQISENIHDLTEEYDVEAFLWDGLKDLPPANLSLNIDLSNEEAYCECNPMKEGLIRKALGELTQWLKAYAKLGQGVMNPASVDPEEKAIALHCATVERYNLYSLKDRSSDAKFGITILRFSYSVGFILTFFMVPLFLGLLFKILNKVFEDNSPQKKTDDNGAGEQESQATSISMDTTSTDVPGPNNTDTRTNTSDTPRPNETGSNTDINTSDTPGPNNTGNTMHTSSTAEEESDNYHYKPIFASVLIISFMYSLTSISIAFYHWPNNEFEWMKTSFLVVLLAWLVILDVLQAVYYRCIKEDSSKYCMKIVLAFLAVLSLGALATDIMLSIPPTILLLFAYPIDSSALIALHIAIFYCATMVLAVYFAKVHKWITKHYKMTLKILKICKVKEDNPDPCAVTTVVFIGWCAHIFLGLVVLVALPITYVCIIFFYQFVVARSNTSDISLNGLPLYIPSVVIAMFGFVIKKGAFKQDAAKKKKKKEEQMLIAQAQKIWTVVGHRLEDDNSSEPLLSQMKVSELARKLKTPKKEETANPVNS